MQKITKASLRELLSIRHESNEYSRLADIPSPSLFKDITKACKRVKEAILNNQRITIVGDYDVDGVVSTTIMVDFFRKLNYPIEYIIPNRFTHGYGLSPKLVEELDCDLVITVDNGISACEAAKILQDRNIDLIITDHHTVGEKIPHAYAIINTKQDSCTFPFKDICGAQIAWYFCAALKQELEVNINMGEYLDILCIAIIADIMPMTSLNYTMVKAGLKKFQTSKRPAIVQLRDSMRKTTYTSDDIGFFVAPKINSAGRMEDASIALEFLLSQDIYEAQEGLDLLDELNNYRKLLQNDIFSKAKTKVANEDKVIVVWDEDWHEGIIGIVASKLSHAFKKPAFVLSVSPEGIAKGSARANADINLHTMVNELSELLLGFGGHKNAAGLALNKENLEEFKNKINSNLEDFDKELYLEAPRLGELDASQVDLEFLQILEAYEPYGLENLKPIFKISKAQVLKKELFGKDKNNIKLHLNSEGFIYEAILFGETIIEGNEVDLVVTVNKNEFRGEVKPQFLIQEVL